MNPLPGWLFLMEYRVCKSLVLLIFFRFKKPLSEPSKLWQQTKINYWMK